MEQVKAAKPNVTPIVSNGGTSLSMLSKYDWDPLGDELGVIMLGEDAEKPVVQNLYETEEYKNLCKLMKGWAEKGYIASDAVTETDNFDALCSAGAAFSTLSTSADIRLAEKASKTNGKNIKVIPLSEARSTTSNISIGWSIPTTSEHPEAAMKFLNLMYSNSDVATLLAYGEEGVNYQTTGDGIIDFLEGENQQNCKYHPNVEWVLPNQFNTKAWAGIDPITTEEVAKVNSEAKLSPAFGFTFDSSSVQNEITACSNVTAKYRIALELGAVDVEKTLPEFAKALKKAGTGKTVPVFIGEKSYG